MRGIVSNRAGYFLWKFTLFVVQLVADDDSELHSYCQNQCHQLFVYVELWFWCNLPFHIAIVQFPPLRYLTPCILK